jgi:parvulin-like peptidyl-prolyl isomerase
MTMTFRQLVRLVPVVILVGFLFSMWGCGEKEDLVAKVGKREITVEQFREFLSNRFRGPSGAQALSFERRMQQLDQQIERELMLLDAYRQGYDKMPDVAQQGDRATDDAALRELYDREIVSKYVNDEALRDFYDKQAEEIRARHILIRVNNREDSVEVAEAKAKIDEIYREVKSGADFAELATEKSEDVTTNKDGGDLQWFRWGRMVDEFQDAVFALDIGEISEPVLTNYGWHIIKLEERRPVEDRPSFGEEKESIKMQVQRMMGEKLREISYVYMDSLKALRELEYDTTTIDMILERLNDKTQPKGDYLFDAFTEDEKQMTVARYDDGEVTLDSVGKVIATRPQMRDFPDRKSITDVADGILMVQFLKDQARREGLYDLPSVKTAGREAREAVMSRQAEKAMVDDRVEITDEQLLEYYEEHKSEFMTEPQRSVREIFIYDDEAKANRVADRAKKGEDFVELAKKYNEKKSTQDLDGFVKPFSEGRRGVMGSEAFKLDKVGDIAGPIKIGNNYSIIRLEEILPSRQKTFGEAKRQIQGKLRRDVRTQIKEEWLESVRKRNRVKVYEDNVAHMFPEDDQPAEEPVEPGVEEPETEPGVQVLEPAKGE